MKSLLRLMTWLSPAFPVGGFSWSHGLEYAVEAGLVRDLDSAVAWIGTVLTEGGGRIDSDLFLAAHDSRFEPDLDRVVKLGEAWRGTSELALESASQGAAFLTAVLTGWPHPRLEAWRERMRRNGQRPAYPVAVGVAARAAGIDRREALGAYLQAFAANLVSAAVRLVPLGQSDGLRALAALEELIPRATAAAMTRPPETMGSAAFMVDWCSMRHETQYTRLFRS